MRVMRGAGQRPRLRDNDQEGGMATLVAIAYPDEATAEQARKAIPGLGADLIMHADQVAAISREPDGKYHITTTHGGSNTGAGVSDGFWGFLFALVFFVPFADLAIRSGMGLVFGNLEKNAIDTAFQEQVRAAVKPGTSALFIIIDNATPNRAIGALRQYGGTVITTSLSDEDAAKLQEALTPVEATAG